MILYVDESACYLLPMVGLTWAPRGQTPVLVEQAARAHLNLIAAIAPNGRIYVTGQDQSFTGDAIVWFLGKLCSRYRKRDLLIIWPGRPLGLRAGKKPRFGSLLAVTQSGAHYRAAQDAQTYAPNGPPSRSVPTLFSLPRLGGVARAIEIRVRGPQKGSSKSRMLTNHPKLTSNMDFCYFIGIDIAKDSLDWAVYSQEGLQLSTHSANTLAGIKTALVELKALPGWNSIQAVFCME